MFGKFGVKNKAVEKKRSCLQLILGPFRRTNSVILE